MEDTAPDPQAESEINDNCGDAGCDDDHWQPLVRNPGGMPGSLAKVAFINDAVYPSISGTVYGGEFDSLYGTG